MGKKVRQTNIELLRMLAMMGVIVLHYNNPSMGGGMQYATGFNRVLLYFIESLCVSAVNLYVLITGYFMVGNQKRFFLKPFELIFQVIFFSVGSYIIMGIFGQDGISIGGIANHILPANYFVILYVVLYLISPLINLVVNQLTEKQLGRALCILLVLFSVYPTLVDLIYELKGEVMVGLSSIGAYGSQWGSTIVNFVLMYMIGAFLKKYKIQNYKKKKYICLLLGVAAFLSIWSVLNDKIGYLTEKTAWEYCNPFVILLAIIWFLLFLELNVPYSKVINSLSAGSFVVYLLHERFLGVLRIENHVIGNAGKMILHLFFGVLILYLLCWCIYWVYEKTIGRLVSFVASKLRILNVDLYGDK